MKFLTARLPALALATLPLLAQAVPSTAQKFTKKNTVTQHPASSPASAGSSLKHPGQQLPTGVSPMPVKTAPVPVATAPGVAAKPTARIQAVNAAEAPKPKVVNEAHAPTLTPVPPTTPGVNPAK
jgi:hypothetical protein